MQYDHLSSPNFGSIVGVKIDPLGLAKHVGILVPHPYWGAAVISFTRQGKTLQSVHEFTGDKKFDSVEYPSDTPWDVVVWRAQTAVINGQYRALTFNCDYFTRYCHGLRLESPQATKLTVAGVLFAVLAFAAVSRS